MCIQKSIITMKVIDQICGPGLEICKVIILYELSARKNNWQLFLLAKGTYNNFADFQARPTYLSPVVLWMGTTQLLFVLYSPVTMMKRNLGPPNHVELTGEKIASQFTNVIYGHNSYDNFRSAEDMTIHHMILNSVTLFWK